MKTMFALILAAVVVGGCSGKSDADFQSKLKTIKLGMEKHQVEDLLGSPTALWTSTNHPGTWTVGTSEVWHYSDGTNLPPVKNGAVYFDERGGVQFVYGQNGRINPPQ